YAAPAPELAGAPNPAPGIRAQATGRYEPELDVIWRGQVRGDQDGVDVLTPLRLDDGTAVLVDRGWIARPSGAVVPRAAGRVVVRGIVEAPHRPAADDDVRSLGAHTISVPHVDLTRIGRGLPYTLRP